MLASPFGVEAWRCADQRLLNFIVTKEKATHFLIPSGSKKFSNLISVIDRFKRPEFLYVLYNRLNSDLIKSLDLE